jgi:hypothetical protein
MGQLSCKVEFLSHLKGESDTAFYQMRGACGGKTPICLPAGTTVFAHVGRPRAQGAYAAVSAGVTLET